MGTLCPRCDVVRPMSLWLVVGVFSKTDQCMETDMVDGCYGVEIPDVETARTTTERDVRPGGGQKRFMPHRGVLSPSALWNDMVKKPIVQSSQGDPAEDGRLRTQSAQLVLLANTWTVAGCLTVCTRQRRGNR